MFDVVPLAELREKIDSLDQEILKLVNERASVAEQVAKTKVALGEEVNFYRPDREALVLRRIRELNKGPLDENAVAWIFREIMSACLALEKPLEIAFLGPEGTFTQQAAFKHFGHAVKTVPSVSIGDIFRVVESGHCSYGVVPVENSTEGVITHTLDSFLTSPLHICGEVEIRVHHNLMARNGGLSSIEEVFSHQQSLAQCRDWLDTHLPYVKRTAVSSNAEAARVSSETRGSAAIAGKVAADLYHLNIIEHHIEDEPDNTTRFLIIGHQTASPTGTDKTSLLVSTGNHPGALHGILEPFAKHGISMTRIESRPSRQGVWDYVFFIDIEGHRKDKAVAKALPALEKSVSVLKILGSYPKAVL